RAAARNGRSAGDGARTGPPSRAGRRRRRVLRGVHRTFRRAPRRDGRDASRAPDHFACYFSPVCPTDWSVLPSAPSQIPRRRRSAPRHARRATTIATRFVIFLDEFALSGMRLLFCARAGAPLRVFLTKSAASALKPPASGCQLRLIAGSARLFVLLQPER